MKVKGEAFHPYRYTTKFWIQAHHLILWLISETKKDKILDLPSILISFGNTWSKVMNSCTK